MGEIISGVTLGRPIEAATRRVPYVRVANVKDGHLDLSSVYEIERGCVWAEEIPDCIHQNHIFRVRFDPDKVNPRFASAQIGSAYGKAYFLAHAKQTTGIATINRSVLAGFPLMLPAVSEQRHVARTVAEQAAEAAVVMQATELELTAIIALPAALLRQAFSGEL